MLPAQVTSRSAPDRANAKLPPRWARRDSNQEPDRYERSTLTIKRETMERSSHRLIRKLAKRSQFAN